MELPFLMGLRVFYFMNGYELSRNWFDFCFDNPEKIKPNHTALYFFCVEHCNRLGWKEKFGLPTTMAKEAIGIRSYNTYINTLNDLVKWGFIIMVEVSKNQYSSNIIALSNFNKALDKASSKALDKALINHATKQSESTQQSIDSIDKPLTNNQKQINKKTINRVIFPFDSDSFLSSWDLWKRYKKEEHRFSYKSKVSEQAALKKLATLSDSSEAKAIEIISQSIENGWKGFFTKKEKENEQGIISSEFIEQLSKTDAWKDA